MEIKLDLPEGVFDPRFPEATFVARVRELAVLELLRHKRLHEHEAQEMLKLDRFELLERMEQVGITPTEKVFARIKSELTEAIASRRGHAGSED